jgi:hypothetical protein
VFESFVRFHVYANPVRQALWGRAAEKASLTWRSPGRFLFFRTERLVLRSASLSLIFYCVSVRLSMGFVHVKQQTHAAVRLLAKIAFVSM